MLELDGLVVRLDPILLLVGDEARAAGHGFARGVAVAAGSASHPRDGRQQRGHWRGVRWGRLFIGEAPAALNGLAQQSSTAKGDILTKQRVASQPQKTL